MPRSKTEQNAQLAFTACVDASLQLRDHRRVGLSGAFSVQEARQHGLSRAQLLGRRWRRLGPGVYAPCEVAEDPWVRLKAALLRLPDSAVFSGPTAAFLHRLYEQLSAVEATLPAASRVSRRVGIRIRRRGLDRNDVVVLKGFRVTSARRTVVDLALRLPLVEAVVLVDTALHRHLVTAQELSAPRRLRRVLMLADACSESPMETRLRLLLVLAGLPRPRVQVSLEGVFARADLYYPEQKLVIEYDGATHRESLAADNRRQNRLIDAGYRVLRFTASDVLGDPESTIALVRKALSSG